MMLYDSKIFLHKALRVATLAVGLFCLPCFLGTGDSPMTGSLEQSYLSQAEARVAEPTPQDFNWYGDITGDGFWDEGTSLEFYQCTGGWKGMAFYLNDGGGYVGRATYYVDITGRMADAQLVMHGHKFYYEGEAPVSEAGNKYVFYGGFSPDDDILVFESEEYGIIGMGPFVEKNGKQYGWCRYLTPEYVEADLLLVRP